MRLHDRYLFRELLTPLAYCLGGFMIFWLAYFFFTELERIQDYHLGLLDTAEYALAMTPGFFVMVLPIALLLALLYALTHHARHQELTALRAAGVGLWRLCLPYFVVGVAAAGVHFFMNEVAVPKCAAWTESILSRHAAVKLNPKAKKTRYTNINFRTAHATRIWYIGEYDTGSTVLVNPNVTWTLPDGAWRALQAAQATWSGGVWVFSNATLFAQSGPNGSLTPMMTTNRYVAAEFAESPMEIWSNIKMSDSQTLRGSREADIPLKDLREYLQLNRNLANGDLGALLTKYYGRLAAPWTCVVVVLIAIPFGAQSGRRNLFFGVAGSIAICFTYFILEQIGMTIGMAGQMNPFLAAWLPNLFFAVLGSVMILRTR
jgi:lipopolysaccharide export system permease protein